ncbi:FAD binding domain-containing protein [Leptodontidium sp. 2 PMI_412]|nr:FAD binding domain-containing protein [Leptodontidium sp. 2 PMI_412]
MRFTTAISFSLLCLQVKCYSPRVQSREASATSYTCKCYEGDSCWPSASAWNALNSTVGGRLVKFVPHGAVCHNTFEGVNTFNADECAEATANQRSQPWLIETPLAPLRTYYSNNTCAVTTNPAEPCTIGYMSDYVIMATEAKHIQAGVIFANRYNIRLVVRNTGHDFMGRSIASGALAINTHQLKSSSFVKKYTGPGGYTGSAATLGAGIQGRELFRLANQQSPKVVVVGGECPTVGFSGGYIQGGGHGPLSTYHGMAADQVLSFDVITAEGRAVTANAKQNPDLFWALKGGGPGTFGIVTSVTVKTFPELPSAGTILNINATHTTDSALFWKAVEAFHSFANMYVDNGIFAYYELSELRLHVQPFVAPNMNAAQLQLVLKPLFDKLDSIGVGYSTVTKEFPTYFDLYMDLFEDEIAGDNTIVGGRFFNRQDIAENNPALVEAFKVAVNPPNWAPGIVIGHIVGPGHGNPVVDNAIHPGWRQASSFSITVVNVPANATKAEKAEAKNILTNTIGTKLTSASPRGGAYVNEGDLNEPNWQTSYWGSNYARLLRIRQTWDPRGVFYASTTVGTEKWVEINDPPRLCKKN